MLAAHAAAPDLEVVDEEGDRELVELLDDQGVGELARRRSSGGRWRWSRRSAGTRSRKHYRHGSWRYRLLGVPAGSP